MQAAREFAVSVYCFEAPAGLSVERREKRISGVAMRMVPGLFLPLPT
jgi:hypothetical protein